MLYYLIKISRHPKFGKFAFITTLIGTFCLVFTIGIYLEFKSSYDVLHNLIDELYMRPWVRVLPYFIGIAGGWYYNEYKNQQFSNVIIFFKKKQQK